MKIGQDHMILDRIIISLALAKCTYNNFLYKINLLNFMTIFQSMTISASVSNVNGFA